MKRKIICILVASIFLFTALNAASKPTNEKKDIEIKEQDCPCKEKTSKLDPQELVWYPGRTIICGFLLVVYVIAGLLKPTTPWGIFIAAKGCGCTWAQTIP
jgi:hypothetical protein